MNPRVAWGYGDRRRSGEQQLVERRPVILKECAKCYGLVDRETLFAGVCPRCPPPKMIANDPRWKDDNDPR